MAIKEIADKMHGIKRIDGEHVTKKEYRKYRKDKIMEGWYNRKEEAEEKFYIIQNDKPLYKIFEEREKLKGFDQRFYDNIEKFVNKYEFKYSDDRYEIARIGRNIICNFIIERSKFLIESNLLIIPICDGENDVTRWFQENCNNIGLYIPIGHIRHGKYYLKTYGPVEGIDYKCKLVDSERSGYFMYDQSNHYIPHIDRNLDENQKQIFYKFCEFVGADSILIELEHKSSNFIRHKHVDLIDMIICYDKDVEIDIPILELSHKGV